MHWNWKGFPGRPLRKRVEIAVVTQIWEHHQCLSIVDRGLKWMFHQGCFKRKHIFLSSKLARAKRTTLLSHSALRRSNTTALQQLPVGDHGGRMNTQMKGSAIGERRLSARLKKWEALRPHTSARPSSLNNAGGERRHKWRAAIT